MNILLPSEPKQSILWVDDEPEFIRPHLDALQEEGFVVETAATVAEAKALLTTRLFSLIILDLLMPPEQEESNIAHRDLRQTGIELFSYILLALGLNKTPIIFLSTGRDKSLKGEIQEIAERANGLFLFLQKPMLPSKFIEEIRKLDQRNQLLHKPLILWVDDEPDFVEPHVTTLKRQGYDVKLISDIEAVIQSLEENNFGLIILDLLMPPHGKLGNTHEHADLRQTGIHLYHLIRSQPKYTETPVIFNSVVRERTGIFEILLPQHAQKNRVWIQPKPVMPINLANLVRSIVG